MLGVAFAVFSRAAPRPRLSPRTSERSNECTVTDIPVPSAALDAVRWYCLAPPTADSRGTRLSATVCVLAVACGGGRDPLLPSTLMRHWIVIVARQCLHALCSMLSATERRRPIRVIAPRRGLNRTRRLACFALCGATPLAAQVAVQGEVRDSLSGKAFAGALVQLVPSATPWSAGLTATSDSAGRFTLVDVVPGRYTLGFQHPRLDSLGFDAVTRVLEVTRNRGSVTANLALPSAATLRASLCGGAPDTTGTIIGRVRDAASDTAATGTVVVARWAELTLGAAGIQRSEQQVDGRVGRDGRYVLCGVPTDVAVLVRAISADSAVSASSGSLEIRFESGVPLLHRDLLVSRHTPDVAVAPAPSSDRAGQRDVAALDGGIATVRRGTARLSGTVADAAGAPVAGARVTVAEAGGAALAGADGTFRFLELPAGSFSVQVIAIGFAPTRTVADLRPDRETRLSVVLARPVATLDSVKVFSARVRDNVGFAVRRQKGTGYFLTAAQVRQMGSATLAASLQIAPSLRSSGGRITGRGGCSPAVYLNGMRIDGNLTVGISSPESIDHVVPLAQLGGIEVYANPADVPAQFGRSGCAAVVIWTKDFVPEVP